MSDPLLIQKLSAQMGYLAQRQTVLSQNIANVDTPNYRAQDLKKLNFDDLAHAESAHLQMMQTSPKHIAPKSNDGRFAIQKLNDPLETKPGGNNVVLEEQLGKISDVGAQHQLATTLFHKYNALYNAALDNHSS